MRAVTGSADGFAAVAAVAAVARAAASSRPRTGRPRVAALSSSACGSFSRRQSAMVCGKAGRACSLVIVSEKDFALKRT